MQIATLGVGGEVAPRRDLSHQRGRAARLLRSRSFQQRSHAHPGQHADPDEGESDGIREAHERRREEEGDVLHENGDLLRCAVLRQCPGAHPDQHAKPDKGANKDQAAEAYTLKFNALNAKYNEMMGKAILRKGKKSPMKTMQDKAVSLVNKVLRR